MRQLLAVKPTTFDFNFLIGGETTDPQTKNGKDKVLIQARLCSVFSIRRIFFTVPFYSLASGGDMFGCFLISDACLPTWGRLQRGTRAVLRRLRWYLLVVLVSVSVIVIFMRSTNFQHKFHEIEINLKREPYYELKFLLTDDYNLSFGFY